MGSLLDQLVAIHELVGAAINSLIGEQGEVEVKEVEGSLGQGADPENCQHKNTQTFQGAGPCPERTVCVDCGKEL